MFEKGRAWVELSMKHLQHNVSLFQALLPEGCALMPAVKANAYGHGASLISKALQKMGIRNYCVASAAEGAELRRAGICGQILILGYTHPEDFDLLTEYDLTQTVLDCAYGKVLEAYGKPLPVHVGIDTGMHRLGETYENGSGIRKLWDYKNLRITGIYSHLCTSDGTTETDRRYMRLQEMRFQKVLGELQLKAPKRYAVHLQGSYGILNKEELTGRYGLARAGIALYGVLSAASETLEQTYDLKPVLSLKARITCTKELKKGEGAGYGLAWHADSARKLAAVSIGYADGVPRTLSNRGHALVRGKKVPVVGRVCMDQLLLDVTDVPEICPGEEAVFIGRSGTARIRAEEMAAESGTITNEILSRLGSRLVRMAV